MNWTKKLILAAAVWAALGGAANAAVMGEIPAPAGVQAAVVQSVTADGRLTSAQQTADAEVMALLWMRTAAEYRALCYQGYNAAMAEIDRALIDSRRGEKPLAIVLDCDETVVDNTAALGGAAAMGNGLYTSPWWNEWVAQGDAAAMPGAAEFLNEVHRKGVAIFYVTNRLASTGYAATERNLRALGFPSVDREHLLLAVDKGNKQERFDTIAAKYDVVCYMGDNAGDLPIGTYGKDRAERNAVIDAHRKDFGTKYIVFPNPVYGAWVSALAKDYLSLSPEERDAVDIPLLLVGNAQ